MKSVFIFLLAISTSFSASASASNVVLDTMGSVADTMTSTVQNLIAGKPKLEVGQDIMINENANIKTFETIDGDSRGVKNLNISAQTEFTVLGLSEDGKTARIGIDSDRSSTADLFVSVAEIENLKLSRIETVANVENDDLGPSKEGLFANRKKRGGMTYCFRDVKKTLVKRGKCNHYPSGVRAEEGYNILARECGMKQVGKASPSSLPTGSVCISGGGRPCGKGTHCGHIAVKLANGMWFGAGTRNTPYLPDSSKRRYAHRYVIGCLEP